MVLDPEAAKAEILKFCEEKSANKTKFYFNDFTKLFPDEKTRDVKKVLTKLIQEEKLVFWSSGSTTMYGLAGAGKQAASEGES
ncbi:MULTISPECIES: dissimilatory sulfite reductase D family protein [unclassified Pseudodesulfovibrio]|uniref:dissimilatory sulfite reductase D family protein n=1 Tax=unclassified Pseudodesulfovibrio TaxID=2661612 RepID=UPI000FEC0D82|nr:MULTISPECIES: dissimilatory sulfite reductase D family protein [unclassified Pseudodesulfovibrio]MCJ2164322.1 dissimilatory sulfite reductase D family protein [Pseudodesulfovibrio sp. S3-i]RWU04532.1 dissimilatory sulfite reductase-asociated protein DsvD [Pseudodesulfovibrio sp. S3]